MKTEMNDDPAVPERRRPWLAVLFRVLSLLLLVTAALALAWDIVLSLTPRGSGLGSQGLSLGMIIDGLFRSFIFGLLATFLHLKSRGYANPEVFGSTAQLRQGLRDISIQVEDHVVTDESSTAAYQNTSDNELIGAYLNIDPKLAPSRYDALVHEIRSRVSTVYQDA